MCKLEIQLARVNKRIQHRWIFHLPTVRFGLLKLHRRGKPTMLRSSTPRIYPSIHKPIHTGSQTLQRVLQLRRVVLQRVGGDVGITAPLCYQLQLQLQPIQLRPHLSQLLLQPS